MAASTSEVTTSEAGLLSRAVTHFLGRPLMSVAITGLPVDVGTSASSNRSFEVEVDGPRFLRVTIRSCPVTERVVLALLDGLRAVPRVHIEETSQDQTLDVVEQASELLLGVDERSKRLAAEALSEVHARFLGRDAQLGAVPPLTEQYLEDFILSGWRGAWSSACRDDRFMDAFGSWTRPVEVSAAHLTADLLKFSHRLQLNTLTHTDVHPRRLLDAGDRALILDWGQARRAPLFLDLGDTFDTVEAGSIYREALAAKGCLFSDNVFSKGHLLARRFAGIRYLPYWLQAWLDTPQERNRAGLQRTLNMAASAAS